MLTRLKALLASLPPDAMPAFLAHRVAALGFGTGDARETIALGRKLRAQMQAMAALKALNAAPGAVEPLGGSVAVMCVLARERRAFWSGYGYPDTEQTCEPAAYAAYGEMALPPLEVEGGHFGVIAACLGHRRPGSADGAEGSLAVTCDKARIRPLVRGLWERKIAHLNTMPPFVRFGFLGIRCHSQK